MSEYYLTDKDKEEILNAIDAFEWKHSRHLPKTNFGYIDWSNDQTIAKCLDIVNKYRSQWLQFAAKCNEISEKLENIQNWRDHLYQKEQNHSCDHQWEIVDEPLIFARCKLCDRERSHEPIVDFEDF